MPGAIDRQSSLQKEAHEPGPGNPRTMIWIITTDVQTSFSMLLCHIASHGTTGLRV